MISSSPSVSSSSSPDPLERLHVYDGLMMNAHRWLVAEDYQRRRQNLQYQSVNQEGIVCGLGVRVISAPEQVEPRFRDARWLEIQPGMAIDREGNPIVVDAAPDRTYRIEARPPSGGSLTIYIVVSYAEPTDPPSQHSRETMREWFRFDQITEPPNGKQVELCRILLTDPVRLSQPVQFFAPQPNQLDFRYRLQASIRPRTTVQIGLLQSSQSDNADLATYTLYQRNRENIAELLHSLDSLYPTFRGNLVEPIHLLAGSTACDFLFLPDGKLLLQFTPAEREALQLYLQQGGGLMIEAPPDEPMLDQIQQIIGNLLSESQNISCLDWQDLDRTHPLRRTPFLFSSLADISIDSLQLYNQGSIIFLQGDLAAAWGLADGRSLGRNQIRTAQELGINLLHFFWQRQQLIRLTQWSIHPDETDE